MVAGSPEVAVGRGDVAYAKGDYGAGLVQIDVVALEDGQAANQESFPGELVSRQ